MIETGKCEFINKTKLKSVVPCLLEGRPYKVASSA